MTRLIFIFILLILQILLHCFFSLQLQGLQRPSPPPGPTLRQSMQNVLSHPQCRPHLLSTPVGTTAVHALRRQIESAHVCLHIHNPCTSLKKPKPLVQRHSPVLPVPPSPLRKLAPPEVLSVRLPGSVSSCNHP